MREPDPKAPSPATAPSPDESGQREPPIADPRQSPTDPTRREAALLDAIMGRSAAGGEPSHREAPLASGDSIRAHRALDHLLGEYEEAPCEPAPGFVARVQARIANDSAASSPTIRGRSGGVWGSAGSWRRRGLLSALAAAIVFAVGLGVRAVREPAAPADRLARGRAAANPSRTPEGWAPPPERTTATAGEGSPAGFDAEVAPLPDQDPFVASVLETGDWLDTAQEPARAPIDPITEARLIEQLDLLEDLEIVEALDLLESLSELDDEALQALEDEG